MCAKVNLAPNTRLLYYGNSRSFTFFVISCAGRKLNHKQFRRMCNKTKKGANDEDKRLADYMADAGTELYEVDAHPRYRTSEHGVGGNGLYIAGNTEAV